MTPEQRLDRLESMLRGMGVHEPECHYIAHVKAGEPIADWRDECDCWLAPL